VYLPDNIFFFPPTLCLWITSVMVIAAPLAVLMLINDGLPFHSRDAHHHFGSRQEFLEARRRGRVRWVVHSIAIDASVPDSTAVRAKAARIVVPDHAIACDDYAAFILGADTKPPGHRWELRPTYLVPHARYRSTHDYALVRQSKRIPDDDVIEIEGVRVTAPLRTASDLLRLRRRPYGLAAADAMAFAGIVKPEDLPPYVSELGRLPGLVQAQELCGRVTHLAESHGESWQRCRILDAGFPTPRLQLPVIDADGVERRLDMAYEEQRVATEYDGREFHTAEADQYKDASRRNSLWLLGGWRFQIGTFERIFGDSRAFEEELGQLIGIRPRPRTWA
jgi:hypothetical protein